MDSNIEQNKEGSKEIATDFEKEIINKSFAHDDLEANSNDGINDGISTSCIETILTLYSLLMIELFL